jgi:hypothetical protein
VPPVWSATKNPPPRNQFLLFREIIILELIAASDQVLVVIPAEAGIHFDLVVRPEAKWIPAFAGMTTRWDPS